MRPGAAGRPGGARQPAAGADGQRRAGLVSMSTPRCWSGSRRGCCRSPRTPGCWCIARAGRQAACCWRARRARCSTWTTAPIPTSPRPTPRPAGPRSAPGIGPTLIHGVLGVVKAYTTRVGNGPLPTEAPSPFGEQLRELGGEFGAVTGRPRRCGWFDATVVRYAARVNGLTGLAVTKLDVLDTFDEIPVCTAYRLGRRALRGDARRGGAAWGGCEPPVRGAARLAPAHRGRATAGRSSRRGAGLPRPAAGALGGAGPVRERGDPPGSDHRGREGEHGVHRPPRHRRRAMRARGRDRRQAGRDALRPARPADHRLHHRALSARHDLLLHARADRDRRRALHREPRETHPEGRAAVLPPGRGALRARHPARARGGRGDA